jgi:hypothetical protein
VPANKSGQVPSGLMTVDCSSRRMTWSRRERGMGRAASLASQSGSLTAPPHRTKAKGDDDRNAMRFFILDPSSMRNHHFLYIGRSSPNCFRLFSPASFLSKKPGPTRLIASSRSGMVVREENHEAPRPRNADLMKAIVIQNTDRLTSSISRGGKTHPQRQRYG